MDITILIATYGDDLWRARGQSCYERHEQLGHPTVWHHGGDQTLAAARNECVDIADSHGVGRGWLCFVDADDHLEPGFVDAMADVVSDRPFELLTPAVRYGPGSDPLLFTDRNMANMNPCVIGTLIHRAVFEDIGRFWEERAWEDWSLFRRAWLTGCQIVFVPGAVYQAGSNRTGRNSRVDRPQQLHNEIVLSHERWLRERDTYT